MASVIETFLFFGACGFVFFGAYQWLKTLRKGRGLFVFYFLNDVTFLIFTLSGGVLIGLLLIRPHEPPGLFLYTTLFPFVAGAVALPFVTIMDVKLQDSKKTS